MKYLLVVIVGLLISGASQGEIISRNVMLKHSDLHIIKNYSVTSKNGLIRISPCENCNAKEFILDDGSILIFDGRQVSMERLLYTRFKYASDSVRIQYNSLDNTVSYIRWSQSKEQEKGLI